MNARRKISIARNVLATATATLLLGACMPGAMDDSDRRKASQGRRASGPIDQGPDFPRRDGNADRGRDVFRNETFGNEGFWTGAVRLPQGMMAAKVTPMQALALGVQIDSDALDEATRSQLTSDLRADPSGRGSAMLNDPMMLGKLVNANAVIGMPIKDSNGDGRMDVANGDMVGASCALCHTVTDGSVFKLERGGSIGRRRDGLANHNLDMGAIFASAANTRALYPVAQLSLTANKGMTLGRAKVGLTENSSEADIDDYFSNKEFYPVGSFDDTFDGNGDTMHNTPLFRQDLAAPYGSEGLIARLDNFSNLVYTSLFDQTMLTTPGGRKLLHTLGGAAGDEIADDYVKILAATGVTGYPYVDASPHPNPGSEVAMLGVRVDETKLVDMNAYLVSLDVPQGARVNGRIAARGREVFRTAGCTGCHNVDQSRRVPSFIVPMARIFPGDNPVKLADRMPPLNPVLNTAASTFDDKMAVVNASPRGEIRGIAMPFLVDLARKPIFLHDDSVDSLDSLLDNRRGTSAPHPFYLEGEQRADVIEFLIGLDAGPASRGR